MWVYRSIVVALLSSVVFVISAPAGAQSLVHSWSQSFGGVDLQIADGIAADLDGNVIVTGYFGGTVDFGGGPLTSAGLEDIFVAKFDAAGNHVWSRRFGDENSQYASGVATDGSGNVIITGDFSGTVDFGGGPLTSAGGDDVYIAKFDAAGDHVWSQRFGDSGGQEPTGITTDGTGNVIVTGHFFGAVDFGGGPLASAGGYDIFLAKFDATGNHLWSRQFGDAESQFAGYSGSVATDGTGDVIVTGFFYGTVDFGGGLLTSAGFEDICVAKFDAAGNHLWSRRFGDGKSQFAVSIISDGSDNMIVTGGFWGTVDFGGGPLTSVYYDIFVAKFDATGNHLWSQRFGSPSAEYASSIAADGSDNLIVTGVFSESLDFGGGLLTSAGLRDVFVVKFDAAGNHLWSQRFGDPEHQVANSVTTDGLDNAIVAGFFEGTVDFGGGPLTSAGDWDIFIAKFDADNPVPTVLQAFEAAYRRGTVEANWRLSEMGRETRFFVLRSDTRRPFVELHTARVVINGLSGSLIDRAVEPGKTYCYRVDVTDEDGRQTLFTTQEIVVPAAEFSLEPAEPNPFNPQTTIHYTVPEPARVRISIYNTRGELVRTLVDGSVPAGGGAAVWNGRDDRGGAVSSGVYFVRLTSGTQVRTSKIVLLK